MLRRHWDSVGDRDSRRSAGNKVPRQSTYQDEADGDQTAREVHRAASARDRAFVVQYSRSRIHEPALSWLHLTKSDGKAITLKMHRHWSFEYNPNVYIQYPFFKRSSLINSPSTLQKSV